MAAGTFAYLVLVVYGSLVPLEFHAMPLGDAWSRFEQISYLRLGIGSRADWVANILLFVPLAYLAMGALSPDRGGLAKALASGIVLAACVASSFAIEFTQVFFPQRTVSINDLVAEAIGAGVGVVLWWTTGARAVRWASAWASTPSRAGAADRLRHAYLFLLFGYQLLPLDLTISVVEIFHKWREGKIVLMPFGADYASREQQIYGLVTDVALWVPVAFLWRLGRGLPPATIWFRVVACAALVEFLQLFVYSRVTSTTNLLTAFAGAVVGVALAGWIGAPVAPAATDGRIGATGRRIAPWVLGIAAWAAVLATVFWYPFDFRADWGFVNGRLESLRSVPFVAYYFGSELRAVTEVLHKMLFFLPWGLLLAGAGGVLRETTRIPGVVLHSAAVVAMLAASGAIEAGQIFLPARHADLTDMALECLGAAAGYAGFRLMRPAWQRSGGSRDE
jgi:VanZ family protein